MANRFVAMIAMLFAASVVSGQAVEVAPILKGIEQRYNTASTIQVNFAETYSAKNRKRAPEKGVLFLRKPGKMRWQYTDPAGKLYVSDGEFIYSYEPEEKRVEKF